ncbi:fumarylacetoacetate hydrolase family protein [Epibacterium sp. MM17-32]|uniref:fumarylacetoacetate hydrolase family protein n=1 Tax=Epibacterium sp. MM17-32 TaxID=2917734 RepID=UPI001EF4A8BC|nr:fumarylacetoacetate hydrolase family protein [Epibacterium sp. MM17-32]MCG7626916.1 fumarylacetoacetate hydrolase family protein [Epibacterium sp. MM17-32]
MKLFRYRTAEGVRPGLIDAEGKPRDLAQHVADVTPETLNPSVLAAIAALDARALPELEGALDYAPCVGGVGKFLCIGLNYSDHAQEVGASPPAHPILFMKANSAIIGACDDVCIPRGSKATDWEVELGVVIGQAAKYVTVEDALDHVAGYCIVNDVSERDFQMQLTGQWTKGKSCDTFGPIGPWLVTADEVPDPQALDLSCDVNGQRMQTGHTSRMIFSVAEIISHLSQLMTLHPGDVIATGTPPGVGMGQKPTPIFLQEGDVMELEIQGLGRQRQNLRADQ